MRRERGVEEPAVEMERGVMSAQPRWEQSEERFRPAEVPALGTLADQDRNAAAIVTVIAMASIASGAINIAAAASIPGLNGQSLAFFWTIGVAHVVWGLVTLVWAGRSSTARPSRGGRRRRRSSDRPAPAIPYRLVRSRAPATDLTSPDCLQTAFSGDGPVVPPTRPREKNPARIDQKEPGDGQKRQWQQIGEVAVDTGRLVLVDPMNLDDVIEHVGESSITRSPSP